MSYEQRIVVDESSSNKTAVVANQRRDARFGSTVHYTSSIVINLQKLQSELQTQHQHEKNSLNDLNQRLHAFVGRVQSLQSENAKYLAAIADLRRRQSGVAYDVKTEEHFFTSRSNLLAIRSAVIDCEWDTELLCMQIAIYKELIGIEENWDKKRVLILEDELKQSSSALAGIRSSYAELQRTVESLHLQCGDLRKQYFALAHDWCNCKKQRRKWDYTMETLKSFISFYKSLHSYSERGYESSVTMRTDDTQYWALELENVVKRIRRDFETFYSTIYKEMITYYETKTVDMETTVKQELEEQKIEYEQYSVTYSKLQIEYEKIQKSYSYEKEVILKLESSCSKLDSEYRSLSLQNEERYEAQATDIYTMQDLIAAMANSVDEIRRSKASLEAEIIVYRLLLDVSEQEKQSQSRVVVRPDPQVVVRPDSHRVTSMGNFSVKKQRKGSIGIKECSPNATFISLVNQSSSKDVDISRWVLTRTIDSVPKFKYTIPDGVRLDHGGELRIYAKAAAGSTSFETATYQKLVYNDVMSWGTGNLIETRLFNRNGDEEAFYSQSIGIRRTNI